MPETEADTCRIYVLPKLYGAGWTDDQIQEQHSFTDGRIVPAAKKIRRLKQKRADYRLRYTRDFPIAVVEAKASYKSASDGLQQAKDYAEILDLKFAPGIGESRHQEPQRRRGPGAPSARATGREHFGEGEADHGNHGRDQEGPGGSGKMSKKTSCVGQAFQPDGYLHNPDFNSLEFEGITNEAGRNSFFPALSPEGDGMTENLPVSAPQNPGAFLLYQLTDGRTRLEVRLTGETVLASAESNGRAFPAGQVGDFPPHFQPL